MTNTGIENKRVKDLSEEELTKLRKEVEDGGYLIEGKIRRPKRENRERERSTEMLLFKMCLHK